MSIEGEDYLRSLNVAELPVQEITEQAEDIEGETLTHKQRVEKLHKVIVRQPLHREILYQILAYAQNMHTLSDLEGYIAALPQFPEATQPQYYLIEFLVNGGGLEKIDLDANGNIIPDADKEGLSEDELDDLIFTWGYKTTELGREFVRDMSPSARMNTMLAEYPDWEDSLVKTLRYLQVKRSTADLNRFLGGLAVSDIADKRLQPSAFVDRFEKAGMIFWNKGWVASDAGKRFLEEYQV